MTPGFYLSSCRSGPSVSHWWLYLLPSGFPARKSCLVIWLFSFLLNHQSDTSLQCTKRLFHSSLPCFFCPFPSFPSPPFPLNTYWSPIPFLRAPSFDPLELPPRIHLSWPNRELLPLLHSKPPPLGQRHPVTLQCKPGQRGPALPHTHVLMFTVCGKRQVAKPKATRGKKER